MATIAAIIGGAGALAGAGTALYGANQASNAAKRQNALQEAMFARQMRLSEEQLRMAQAGTRNARGDTTQYIPGVGWVETPSDTTRRIITASDNEELARLEQDAPRQRMQAENNFRTRSMERGVAGAMLARGELGRRTVEDMRGNAVRTGIADAAAAPNEMRRAITLTSLRQGSGGETALATMARQGMQDRRSVLARADAGAPGAFAEAEDQRLNGPINRYGQFATRAAAMDGPPPALTNLADTLTASRSRQQAVAPQAIGSAMNIDRPQIMNTESRLPVRIGSFGDAASGMYSSLAKLFRGNGQSAAPEQQYYGTNYGHETQHDYGGF